ncbi:hypothetical protein B0H11DRAFT_1928305 [Mycena galericulata]|nr:hypothetical protein B0H11DRAFT_1928305 [Mycena galericulata]
MSQSCVGAANAGNNFGYGGAQGAGSMKTIAEVYVRTAEQEEVWLDEADCPHPQHPFRSGNSEHRSEDSRKAHARWDVVRPIPTNLSQGRSREPDELLAGVAGQPDPELERREGLG